MNNGDTNDKNEEQAHGHTHFSPIYDSEAFGLDKA